MKSTLPIITNIFLISTITMVTATAAPPPNIVLLMADQLRWDAVGAYGINPGAKTPNLDKLASEGVLFNNAYSSTPTCTPARAALLTGLSPWYHGMIGYGVVAPEYNYEVARVLSANNYQTTVIGKNHFWLNTTTDPSHGYETEYLYDGLGTGFASGGTYDTYDQYFQTVLPGKDPLATGSPLMDWNSWNGAPYVYNESLHPTAWVGQLAVNYLQNATANQPFFLKVSFHRPHSPYDPPARLLDSTPASDLPPIYAGNNSNWDGFFKDNTACDPSNNDAWCGEMPDPNVTLARRAYYANIRFVDEWIGNILMALDNNSQINDNTFIIFISDHGDGQGDHYHWRKGYPYEFSSHVPMIFRWPASYNSNLPRNSTSNLVTEIRDIFPTMLDIAGITPPKGTILDGLPLTCILQDPTGKTCEINYTPRESTDQPETKETTKANIVSTNVSPSPTTTTTVSWRQWIDMEHDICYNITNHWNSLTDGEIKYVFIAYDATEQLFNLTNDPYEFNDVSKDNNYKATLQLWRQRLVTQFENEQRGTTWVKNGILQARPGSQTYSPYYPKW